VCILNGQTLENNLIFIVVSSTRMEYLLAPHEFQIDLWVLLDKAILMEKTKVFIR
jgi:hypothetical protein